MNENCKISVRTWFVAAALLAPSASAVNWYVDQTAQGANSGTTWVNGWTTLGAINWRSVAPGDTIYISGGTYFEHFTIGASGTAGQNIVIRASQEAGHNSPVILAGRISCAQNYVTLNGAKSDTYAATWITNTVNVPMITNNINWFIAPTDGGSCVTYTGVGPVGMEFLWLDMSSTNDTSGFGVLVNQVGGSPVYSNIVAYCYIHHVYEDAVHVSSATGGAITWDLFTVHHCWLDQFGDDGVEAYCFGMTVHNNIISNARCLSGHPDGCQIQGPYVKIYNNIIFNVKNSIMRNQFYSGPDFGMSGSPTNCNNYLVYGNLCYQFGAMNDTTVGFVWDNHLTGNNRTSSCWSNIVCVNNTIACSAANGLGFSKGDVTNLTLQAVVIDNNCIWWATNSATLVSIKGTNGPGYQSNCFWAQADVEFDYNNLSGSPNKSQYGNYATNTAEGINAATIWTHNNSKVPTFMDYRNGDFRPAANDTALRGRGKDLSYLNLPDINVDIYGHVRGANGSWDIGVVQSEPQGDPPGGSANSGLLLYLSCDDNFVNADRILDRSGNGHDAMRFGFSATPTNWPTRVAGVNGGYAAHFTQLPITLYPPGNTNNYRTGQYAAITNIGTLSNLTSASICFWGEYDTSVTNTMSMDHNATFLDCGVDTPGCWHFGRYYSSTYGNTRFMVVTNGGMSESTSRLTWPEDYSATYGNSGGWHHYAVTVQQTNSGTCLLVNGYFNGTNFGNMIVPGVTNLTVNKTPQRWIGIGCWTHGGTATLDDGDHYPNNGWLDGSITDVRIYGRVLSANEIEAIASGSAVPTPPQRLQILSHSGN
ncbi:MAG: LamG-like jellyroll fold domain-containing protein [Verrucomicrobiota bacterium]|jgi:hypothetical protein